MGRSWVKVEAVDVVWGEEATREADVVVEEAEEGGGQRPEGEGEVQEG